MRERVCRRGHHVREGENGRVKPDGELVCIDCQKAVAAGHKAGVPLRDMRGPVAHPANPWAGRVLCPDCDSSEWTLPYDPTVPGTSWRCVACHCWANGPLRGTTS